MANEEQSSEYDTGEVIGEHPAVEPTDFARSAGEYFESSAERMDSLTPESHEVVVQIGKQIIPASELKLRLKKSGEFVIEHKEIVIVVSALTVASILAARRAMRTRKK